MVPLSKQMTHFVRQALTRCHLCRDALLWCNGMAFPTQGPVCECVQCSGRCLKCVVNAWLMDDRPWTLTQQRFWFTGVPIALLRRLTAWRRVRHVLDFSCHSSLL